MAKRVIKNPETGCRPESLFGMWYMDPERLQSYRDQLEGVDLGALAKEHRAEIAEREKQEADADPVITGGPPQKPYPVHNGVAVLTVSGPTTKYDTSMGSMFGGTSTVRMQRLLRQAAADQDVKRILMHFEDAPGGTVAGAYELRDTIREVAKAKPVAAHVDGMCCSAAYLFAAATGGKISAYQTAYIGSIGTRAHLDDSSKAFEMRGVKRIPVAAGTFKAAGLPGTVITDAMIAETQKHVDELNELFINSVSEDRKIDPTTIREMEARTYIAKNAVDKKLVDRVCSFDEALADFQKDVAKTTDPTLQRTRPMNFLQQIAALLGMPADATEQGVTDRVRTLQQTVNAIPKPPDPDTLAAHLEVATERINLSVEKQKIPATVANTLKIACGWNEKAEKCKPSALMLTKSAELDGKRPVDFALALFDDVKLADVKDGGTTPKPGEKTPVQGIIRQVPGEVQATEEEKMAEASAAKAVRDLKEQRGIPAETK